MGNKRPFLLSSGMDHTVTLIDQSQNGVLISFGRNNFGQLVNF